MDVILHTKNACNNNFMFDIDGEVFPKNNNKSSSKNNKKNNSKKYYRKRNIPSTANKNYPTKPKSNDKDTKHSRYMKYNMINDYGNVPDMHIEYISKQIIQSDNEEKDNGILGALICENDKILKITFLDSITKKYVVEPYEMMVSGIEPYVWVPPEEYIEPEIQYEIIWKRLDYEFYKYERPYIYKSKLEGGPSIQFYDYDISKL